MNTDDMMDDDAMKSFGVDKEKIVQLLASALNDRNTKMMKAMWSEQVFVVALAALKGQGIQLPDKQDELQFIICLILAQYEASNVKRILDSW